MLETLLLLGALLSNPADSVQEALANKLDTLYLQVLSPILYFLGRDMSHPAVLLERRASTPLVDHTSNQAKYIPVYPVTSDLVISF